MEFMMLAAAGHVAPAVAPWITYLFTGLLVAMVLCLALEEKIHAQKSVIVGVTAVIALLLGAFTGSARCICRTATRSGCRYSSRGSSGG